MGLGTCYDKNEQYMILFDNRLPEFYSTKIRDIFPEEDMVPFYAPGRDRSCVYDAIRSHPDIYCMQFSSDTFIVAPCVKDLFDRLALKYGFKVIEGNKDPSGKYPETAGYNALRCGEYLIHNNRITDKTILEISYEHGLEMLEVKQGYSRCSCIPVADKALITSDKGIAGAALKRGFDVLYVEPETIILPSCEHGFIGGAAGVKGNSSIFFCGDIRKHPRSLEILRFIKQHNADACWVEGVFLFDCGSFIFI